MPLTTQLEIRHSSRLTGTAGLSTPTDELNYTKSYSWSSGTGADQADKQFRASYTIGASATQSLDLAGALTDAFGATITFAKIKKVEVYAAAGNTNNVNVVRPASGVPLFLAASDGIPVLPGGAFIWVAPGAAGITVTATSGDLLELTNSGAGTSVTVDIIIVGTSA